MDVGKDLQIAYDDGYKRGEWDMFEMLSSAWYGKQAYFQQGDGLVYSRISDKYMKPDVAVAEFSKSLAGECDDTDIVCCNECIHYVRWILDSDSYKRYWCDYHEWTPKETDFCSRGYRKGESEDESECD